MIADLLFILFGAGLLVWALGVITAKNPMLCVLFLIGCFVNAAALFLLLGAEFLGLLLIMVYVGAVAVMFLFVVMTINVDFAEMKEGFAAYLPLGLVFGILLLAQLGLGVWGGLTGEATPAQLPIPADEQNIVAIGKVLFTNYALPFQLAGLILLTAMIGAIVLTHRKRAGVRRQRVEKQVGRKREESVKVVKVGTGQPVTESHFVGRGVGDE